MSPPIRTGCDLANCPTASSFERMERDLSDIKMAILGDIRYPDRPGMASRLQEAEQSIKELKEMEQERRDSRKALNATTIGAAITSVIGAAVAAIAALIHKGA